jgi:hypothetical protein
LPTSLPVPMNIKALAMAEPYATSITWA